MAKIIASAGRSLPAREIGHTKALTIGAVGALEGLQQGGGAREVVCCLPLQWIGCRGGWGERNPRTAQPRKRLTVDAVLSA